MADAGRPGLAKGQGRGVVMAATAALSAGASNTAEALCPSDGESGIRRSVSLEQPPASSTAAPDRSALLASSAPSFPSDLLCWLRTRIHKTLRRKGVVSADCDDITQQALIEVSIRFEQLCQRPQNELLAYALCAAEGARCKFRRGTWRRERLEREWTAVERPGGPTPDDVVTRRELWLRRFDLLNELPDELRCVLMACDLEGIPIAEAARSLQIPIGTAKTRLRRARGLWRSACARRGL